MKSWFLKDESSKHREIYTMNTLVLKNHSVSSNTDIVSKLFSQGPLACYVKKKKVAKLVLTHLLRTDKQKFTKAVLNKVNSEGFFKFSQSQ